MTPEASFIVPTYRRAAVLEVAVPLFLGQRTDAAFEVIVVSDGPDPETDAVMARLAAPNLHYVALPENAGPSTARNRAIGMARGRILVFVDDDSLIKPDFLARHLAHHAGQDDRLVTGPILDVSAPPEDMENPPPAGIFNRHFNPLPTGNASVARAHVTAVGGFDEGFREYGWEDPEFCARLMRRPLQTRFERAAPIYHWKPPAANRSLAARLRRELARGRNGARFHAKHPTLSVALQTKRWAGYRALDRLLDPVLRLDRRMLEVLAGGPEPGGLMAVLLLAHAEIEGGRGREVPENGA